MENQAEIKLVSQLSIEQYEQLYFNYVAVVVVSIKNTQQLRTDAKSKRGLKKFPDIINH